MKGESAKATYDRLSSYRWQTLERARACSALTLPGIQPPQWATDQTPLPTPYQSLGARGVNNLSSKLLLAMFPPGQPFFRLAVQPEVAAQLGTKLSKIQIQLADVEDAISTKVEQSHVRPLMSEVLKHLIVTGNVLLHVPNRQHMRFFRLDQFVIVRDAMDRPIRAVVEEKTVVSALKPEVAIHCKVSQANDVQQVCVYTDIRWNRQNNRTEFHQEINGIKVPGSDGWAPKACPEWIPLRWSMVPGRDYGRGLVEEYLGDLRSLEGISQAIVQFAAAAAKIVMLVHPNSTTNVQELNNAESGDAIVGSKGDIDILQLEKQADYQVAAGVASTLEQRLSYAFLLQTGTTRNAERVTAEEIRATAQELEDALGGVYTVLAEDLQLPLVNRLMAVMTKDGEIRPLPSGAIHPVVVTGFEALGRNHQLNKLRQLLADLNSAVGEQVVGERMNFNELARRFALGYGIQQPNDLWLSDAQVQANRNTATAQQALVKGAPQAAGAIAKQALGQGQGQ